MNTFDVVILGAGPGGYVAAIRASQLGLKTAIIEKEQLGGVCLNWGCIPTKSLLRSAEVYRTVLHAKDFGVTLDHPKPDLQKMVERSRAVASQLSNGIKGLLKKNKVTHIQGHGHFINDTTIEVDHNGKKQRVIGKNIIIATGARARELPHLKADGKRIWLAKHAMTPAFMPEKLLIVGSGAIGIEFASFYQTIGAQVTVVEMVDRILPQEDRDISKQAKKQFEAQGMIFHLSSSVTKLTSNLGDVEATILDNNKKEVTEAYDAVILAIGIQGNTEELGLDKTKITVDKNQIQVNEYNQTAHPHIYAIGDIAGAPWLAHKASHEGIIVAEHIKGLKPHPINKQNIPGCTYAHPQVASVGMTEDQVRDQKIDVNIGMFPLMANGKALAVGEPEGFIKTIFDKKTGELLGAHMIGHEVTEMIHGYVIAKQLETTEAELTHTIFPHPTLSEAMHESVLAAFGQAIHY